jgi:predicted amidohydrolase
MDLVRVALVKVMPAKFAVEKNWAALEHVVRQHASARADVFISPEGFLDGYASTEESCDRARLAQVAEALKDGPHVRKARDLARKLGSYFLFCFTEKRGRKLFNAAALIGRKGEVVGVYHKTHLQKHDLKYDPGQALPVFATDFGKVGIIICADRRWPETVRTLRLKGAQLILNPTYGMHDDLNKAMMRTRSYESNVFICFAHPLQALITNPHGAVEAELVSSRPDVLVHDIDLSLANRAGHLEDRRPDLYKGLEEKSRKMGRSRPRLRGK